MWMTKAHNFKAMESIFGREPSLKNICLYEVSLSSEGASMIWRFDVDDFPESPPKKWIQAGFNTAQIVLSVWGVDHVSITDWSVDNTGDLNIFFTENGVQLYFKSEKIMYCEGTFFRVENVSGYIKK